MRNPVILGIDPGRPSRGAIVLCEVVNGRLRVLEVEEVSAGHDGNVEIGAGDVTAHDGASGTQSFAQVQR